VAVRWLGDAAPTSSTSSERAGIGQQPRATPTVPTAGAPDAWLGDAPVFLKSASEIPNLVGVAGFPNIGYQLTALSGESGKVLWHAPANNGARAYTDGGSALLLADNNQLSRYDAHSGKKLWAISVADYIHDVTFGPNCASAYLRYDKILGIALESGQASPCTPVTPAVTRAERSELKDYRASSGDLSIVGSLRADPKPINPEPTRLAVQVSRAGHVLWEAAPSSLEPVWVSSGFPRSITLSSAGVFVFGRHSGDGLAQRVLLDLASGRILYDQTGTTKVNSFISLASAGPMVFVSHDTRLEAYRAATGALVWFVGTDS
jgi:outer membrane protein assembly factor BamB